jgi:hypothetical protein
VVDENFPQGLEALFREPKDAPGVRYFGQISDMQIYLINP